MKWHGFALERAQSPDYWRLPRAVIGAHQVALWQCAEAENAGVWRDAAGWSEREWIRFAGIDLAELAELAAAGLVVWLTRDETDRLLAALTPSSDGPPPDDWERCRVTFEAVALAVGECADRDRSDAPIDATLRSLHVGGCADRDRLRSKRCIISPPTPCANLCILDYDLGGQLAAAISSEKGKKMAVSRWSDRAHQQELPFKSQRTRRDVSSSGDLSNDPEIDAQAMHSYSYRDRISPQPPSRGADGAAPDRERTDDPRESLWIWLLGARPRALSCDRWGGGRDGAFRTLDAVAASLCVPVGVLCDRIQADLRQKFENARWVADVADSKRGFRGYVRDRDFETPAPAIPIRSALALVPAAPKTPPEARGWGPPPSPPAPEAS